MSSLWLVFFRMTNYYVRYSPIIISRKCYQFVGKMGDIRTTISLFMVSAAQAAIAQGK